MQKALPAEIGADLARLLVRYRWTKEELVASSAEIDAASICCECEGQCCLNGKYRINSLDYLAHLAADVPVVADFSHKPLCPYGSKDGCRMEPGLRPSDCVLFICDGIDQKLSEQTRTTLEELERRLRTCVLDASRLIDEEVGMPLLLWAERTLQNSNNLTKVL